MQFLLHPLGDFSTTGAATHLGVRKKSSKGGKNERSKGGRVDGINTKKNSLLSSRGDQDYRARVVTLLFRR